MQHEGRGRQFVSVLTRFFAFGPAVALGLASGLFAALVFCTLLGWL